jgi:hypothetical protein
VSPFFTYLPERNLHWPWGVIPDFEPGSNTSWVRNISFDYCGRLAVAVISSFTACEVTIRTSLQAAISTIVAASCSVVPTRAVTVTITYPFWVRHLAGLAIIADNSAVIFLAWGASKVAA